MSDDIATLAATKYASSSYLQCGITKETLNECQAMIFISFTEQLVKSCPNCAKASTPHKGPLLYSALPNHPLMDERNSPSNPRKYNGPQHACRELWEKCRVLWIQTRHQQSTQSNGMARRSVKTVKSLLEKSSDPYMAVVS